MAKIKVKQIEDLLLTQAGAGTRTITIGANNVITPLTGVTEPTGDGVLTSGAITGLTVSGNSLIPTYSAIPVVNDGKLFVQFGDQTAVNPLFTANQEGDETLTLANVAQSGLASDVKVTDTEEVITATTVEGALVEIAKEIDAMDLASTAIVSLVDGKTLQASNIKEEDGKVTVETAATLVEFNQALGADNKAATMKDIANITVVGEKAIKVDTAEGQTGKVVSLELADETILTQDENGLKATLGLTYDSAAKAIKLWGTSTTTPLATVDATDFIKDGMLEDAEIITASNEEDLVAGKRYIKFTFKTYQQGQEGVEEFLKVEYLDVEDLFDSYTSGNEWIKIDQNANTISHKTQDAFSAEGATKTFGSKTDDGHFSFPKVTVDAAGHVTGAEEIAIAVTTTVYVPKREDFVLTKETIASGVTLTYTPDTDSDVDVYLNGQLLAKAAVTVAGNVVKAAPYSTDGTIELEEGDMIMVRYYVKETASVTPQA